MKRKTVEEKKDLGCEVTVAQLKELLRGVPDEAVLHDNGYESGTLEISWSRPETDIEFEIRKEADTRRRTTKKAKLLEKLEKMKAEIEALKDE